MAISRQPRPDHRRSDIPAGHITNPDFLLLELSPIEFASHRLAFCVLRQKFCRLRSAWLRALWCRNALQVDLDGAAVRDDVNRAAVDDVDRAGYLSLCEGGE